MFELDGQFKAKESPEQRVDVDSLKETAVEIGNEGDLEKLAGTRIEDLETMMMGLQENGQKRIENTSATIGLTPEKIAQVEETIEVKSRLERIFQRGKELIGAAKEKIMEIITSEEFGEIVEATPFAGGVKKIGESISGQKLSGEKIEGFKRLTHGMKGASDVVTDFIATKKVEKGARLVHVGKKTAEGVKANPETMTKLGKKILGSKKENINDIGK
jgi:hypothetical protein